MADDGMLLNFELGDTPLTSQVKFKGGRWRDRVRAQKSVKKWEKGQPKKDSSPPSVPSSGRPKTARYIPGVGVQVEGGDDDVADRPAKRPRTDGNTQAASNGKPSERPQQPRPNIKSGHTSSKLFTSNPAPITTFGDKPAEEAEEAVPSNAPLSAEGEDFLALGLSRRLAQHLSTKMEMKAPTAIQKHTIPQLVKEDNDAFLQAETGSGKTLAYLLPIVQRITALSQNEDGANTGVQIHRDSGLFAIVLAPTRELCKQIAAVLERLLRCAPWIVSTTVTGGESKKSEKARLRKGVNILIATPGRLTDHLDNTKVLDVGTVRWLVLDEGDRMMEMGFEDDLKTIVGAIRKDALKPETKDGVVLGKALPSRRVTVLCSATMKMNVQKLGEISLVDAVHITATTTDEEKDADGNMVESAFAAPSQLKQSYLIVPAKLRLVTLIALLKSTFARKGSVMKAIIFISCADSVNFHFDLLKSTSPGASAVALPSPESPTTKSPHKPTDPSADTTVAPATYITSPANPTILLHKLHGSLPQSARTATLTSFTSSRDPAVLITTDISSRGLDVPAVDLVVEYDPAFAAAEHVHRVGRTARAGRPGKAVVFLQPGCEEGYVEVLGKHGASSAAPAPQLYDAVLQKGLSTPVQLPGGGETEDEDAGGRRQTWMTRAEALQLSIEQRLLVKLGGGDDEGAGRGGQGRNRHAHAHAPQRDNPLLEAARQAFKSHVRAYATHVREERGYFDKGQLHLGHMAKSFGLREAPAGIGGGAAGRKRSAAPGGSGTRFAAAGQAQGQKRKGGAGSGPGEDADGGEVDEEARRRMREKMNALAKASASEFNIG